MKRLAIILTVVAATAMIFSSCGKYEEGPSFSLLTKKARIVGDWKVDEMYVNDTLIDFAGFFAEIAEETGIEISNVSMETKIEKDGTGISSMKYTVMGIGLSEDTNLKWEFDDTKENLRTQTQDSTGVWSEWNDAKILRLTKSECWLESQEDDGDGSYTLTLKMVKKD